MSLRPARTTKISVPKPKERKRRARERKKLICRLSKFNFSRLFRAPKFSINFKRWTVYRMFSHTPTQAYLKIQKAEIGYKKIKSVGWGKERFSLLH